MLELLYHFLVPDASVFDADGNGREPPPMVSEEFTIDMLESDDAVPQGRAGEIRGSVRKF